MKKPGGKRCSPATRKFLSDVFASLPKPDGPTTDILRSDLNHVDYADWFFDGKFCAMRLDPRFALNDFVLFRVALGWPRGAGWAIDARAIEEADFQLTSEEADDLRDFSTENLTDGYREADWFLRVAITWYLANELPLHESMFRYVEERFFTTGKARQGRRRADGIDRDLVIRNAFLGLIARGAERTAAWAIVSDALGRLRINVTPDGVRKICERSKRSEREARYWHIVLERPSSGRN